MIQTTLFPNSWIKISLHMQCRKLNIIQGEVFRLFKNADIWCKLHCIIITSMSLYRIIFWPGTFTQTIGPCYTDTDQYKLPEVLGKIS